MGIVERPRKLPIRNWRIWKWSKNRDAGCRQRIKNLDGTARILYPEMVC